MVLLRKLLFPLALLYGGITALRNLCYHWGWRKAHSYEIPMIAVGNLSVGGTGKSPQIEYLIRLLSPQYRVAVLSRGYKRKTQGLVVADETATAQTLGDEPYQFYRKFPQVQVAVDANRNRAIQHLLSLPAPPEFILLDDAYQHRKVNAGFYVLLTAYGDLFCDDYMLPTGHLREPRSGAQRAQVVIVTKCPPDLSVSDQERIRQKLKVSVPVFFSSVTYAEEVFSVNNSLKVSDLHAMPKLLLAGIAKPEPFFAYLQHENDVVLRYPDHHDFTEVDIKNIQKQSINRVIVTTEKDYVRLLPHFSGQPLYYLPIQTSFLSDAPRFDQLILDYVGTSTTNRSIH